MDHIEKPVPIVTLWLDGLETLHYLNNYEQQHILACAEQHLNSAVSQIETKGLEK